MQRSGDSQTAAPDAGIRRAKLLAGEPGGSAPHTEGGLNVVAQLPSSGL